jgi:hypothetical protein
MKMLMEICLLPSAVMMKRRGENQKSAMMRCSPSLALQPVQQRRRGLLA